MTQILQPTYLSDNVFADILEGRAPAHRIYENRAALAFLDIAPQGPGHTLVIPKEDAANLCEINSDSFENTGNKRGHSSDGSTGLKRGHSC